MANYRYTKTPVQIPSQCRTRFDTITIKGDSTTARELYCVKLSKSCIPTGFAENAWTLIDTVEDPHNNNILTPRYGKMLYNQKIFPQVKPPVKSLFGHKSNESANYGQI